MIAVRKLNAKSASAWSQAQLSGHKFDDLSLKVISDWQSDDGQVSIYVVDKDDLAIVALALTMLMGDGPKGASFACVEFEKIKSAGLTVYKTKSNTMVHHVDEAHHDVSIKRGRDLRSLIDVFLDGEVRSVKPEDVELLALANVRDGSYNFQSIASARKGKAASEATGVCNSALALIAKSKLEIRVA